MKILFVGSGKTDNLIPSEHLFKEKLRKASLTDVEVTVADMAQLTSPGEKGLESELKGISLFDMDAVIVMAKWEKELLTRYLDYQLWDKIYLFHHYLDNQTADKSICEDEFPYKNESEKIESSCNFLIEKLKSIFRSPSARPDVAFV